jgi:hypothetical protein
MAVKLPNSGAKSSAAVLEPAPVDEQVFVDELVEELAALEEVVVELPLGVELVLLGLVLVVDVDVAVALELDGALVLDELEETDVVDEEVNKAMYVPAASRTIITMTPAMTVFPIPRRSTTIMSTLRLRLTPTRSYSIKTFWDKLPGAAALRSRRQSLCRDGLVRRGLGRKACLRPRREHSNQDEREA